MLHYYVSYLHGGLWPTNVLTVLGRLASDIPSVEYLANPALNITLNNRQSAYNALELFRVPDLGVRLTIHDRKIINSLMKSTVTSPSRKNSMYIPESWVQKSLQHHLFDGDGRKVVMVCIRRN